jgi:hypothetical protein
MAGSNIVSGVSLLRHASFSGWYERIGMVAYLFRGLRLEMVVDRLMRPTILQ